MLRDLKHPHLGAHVRGFQVTTLATPAITVDIGAGDKTAAARNSAGKGTLTPYRVPHRAGIVLSQAGPNIASGGYGSYDTDPSATAIVSETLDASGSGDDGTAYVMAIDYLHLNSDRSFPFQKVSASIRAPRLMAFRISSAGAAAVGAFQVSSVSKASSIYTVTFRNAFRRQPLVFCSPIATAQKACNIASAPSASAVAVSTFSAAEAAEDNSFYMVVYGDDSKDENWGMSRLVEVPQIKPRMECFRISGSGAASIALGSTDATLVDNGTGDYSLTWTKAFAREPVVIVTAKAGRAQVHSTATTTAARVLSFNAAGSATDDDINVLVIGYDYVTEV